MNWARSSGSTVWRWRMAGSSARSWEPRRSTARSFAGTEEGRIHGLHLETGAQRWVVEVEGPIKGLSTDGDVLYIGTQPGRLYALRLPGQ